MNIVTLSIANGAIAAGIFGLWHGDGWQIAGLFSAGGHFVGALTFKP